MAVNPKVPAAATAAGVASLVVTTVAAHVFHGSVPADVLRLAESALAAGFAFAGGWFVRSVPEAVAEVAETAVAQVADEVKPAA